jgi:hypothetical protein
MIQISYVSAAAHPLTAEELLALLEQCLKNNAANGITGMLLYGNGTFLQTLEGDEKTIDALVERIRTDPRHAKIQFLSRTSIQSRHYSEWTMGFKRVSDRVLQAIPGLNDFGERNFNFDFLTQNDSVVETLMNHYRSPHWDPLIRELDAKDKVIEHLTRALTHVRGSVEIATLVLESVKDASRTGSLSESHLRLCDSALESLRGI